MDCFTKITERLQSAYRSYETKIETDNGINYFVIINPFWDENIRVSYDENSIILFFSFQHAHFYYCNDIDENIDSLIEYINEYLVGKRVVIEFLHDEKSLFGGDYNPSDIDTSSSKSILQTFAGVNTDLFEFLCEKIRGCRCRCSIRGWDNANNKDIEFTL